MQIHMHLLFWGSLPFFFSVCTCITYLCMTFINVLCSWSLKCTVGYIAFLSSVWTFVQHPERLKAVFHFLFFSEDDVVSMADSTITVDDIEGELFKIERIRDILVRRESELRYMWGLNSNNSAFPWCWAKKYHRFVCCGWIHYQSGFC